MAYSPVVTLAICLTVLGLVGCGRGQGVVSLAGAPDAMLDSLELLEGKLKRTVTDSLGNDHQVASTLSRIEVLENDKILGKWDV